MTDSGINQTGYGITEKEIKLADKIAGKAAAKWSGVDEEEIAATLHLWLVENETWVERYRTEEGGRAKLTVALTRAAHRACAAEHRAVHHQADASHYTLTELKRLLPYLWEKEAWTQTVTPDLAGAPTHTSTGSDSDRAITMLLDVDSAFHALTQHDRDLLAWRYHDDDPYLAIGDRLGITEDAARMAVKRALERLHRLLGGDGRYN